MDLKQRKILKNRIPKFNAGDDMWSQYGGQQPSLWGNYENTSGEYWPELVRPLTVPNQPSNIPLTNPMGEYKVPEISDIPSGFGVQQQEPQQEQQGDKSGGGVNPNGIMAGATNLIGGIMSQLNSVKGRDELLTDAGRSNQSVMGINFTTQNNINKSAELHSLDKSGLNNTVKTTAAGAQIGGSIVPGIGHAVGAVGGLLAGVFSWGASKHKLRKRIENAQNLAFRRNVFSRSNAMTSGLQQNFYSEHGGTGNGILYANRGKDLRQPKYEK